MNVGRGNAQHQPVKECTQKSGGDFKIEQLGTKNNLFFLQLMHLRGSRLCGGQPDGVPGKHRGDPAAVQRAGEPQIHPYRPPGRCGRDMDIRVPSRRLSLYRGELLRAAKVFNDEKPVGVYGA